MQLYGAPQSPFVRKVRIALEEKGLPYQLEGPNLEEYADTQMAEGMGAIVLERIVKPHLLGQPTDEARLAQLLESVSTRWFGKPTSAAGQPVPAVLDYLESELPADRDSVLARFGIADVALGAQLGWLAHAGLALDSARWPRTARYHAALLARPSFEATR